MELSERPDYQSSTAGNLIKLHCVHLDTLSSDTFDIYGLNLFGEENRREVSAFNGNIKAT